MNLPPYGDQYRRTNAHFSSLKVMPSPEPDMFVNITPGGFWLTNKIWKEYVGGRSPGFTAPTQNAKWDLLCIHYNGSPMIIPGTQSTDPVLPPLQRKAFPLAAIYLEAGDTKITSEKIFDLRFFHSTSFSHVDFEDLDHVNSHPIEAITGLREELDTIESGDYWGNVLDAKADVDGTPEEMFTLNRDFTGTPSADCGIQVERGVQPNAIFHFNEQLDQWEYTNNGTDWVQLTNEGPSVSLPVASTTVLGGVKIGSNLTIVSGVLSANIQSSNDFTNTYLQKLDSIEPHATGDMTPSEIKTSYESNINTNAFTDAEKTKLAGIDDGATAGTMSAADIKVAYESNANTNAFTDSEKNKLATVETGATADMSAVEIKSVYESNTNTNAFTDTEKTKLAGIATGANNYIHPTTHDPTIIVQNSNYRFVSDAEKTTWSSKADPTNYWSKSELAATGGSADRVDWSQIQNPPAFGSENWLDPVANIAARDALTPTAGDCVLVQDDGDGSAAQYTYNGSTWVKIADVDWTPMTDAQVKASYENNANTNAFTDAEKTKLGTVEDNANNFSLDPASNEALGGVMVGSGLNVDPSGLLTLDYVFDDAAHGVRGGGNLHQIASTESGGFMSSADKVKLDGIQAAANHYVLPSADDVTLGGVKIGGNINFLGDGTISVPTANADNVLGLIQVKTSSYLSVAADGGIDIPSASATVHGAVQIGANIDVSGGVISVSHASGAALGVVKVGDNIVLNDLTGEISVDWNALPFDDSMHGTRLGGNLHALSTTSAHGFMSSSDKTKLDGIESGATADMTATEIKTAYESNADTNVFNNAAQSKLSGIEDGATGDMTSGEIKASYESNADTNAFTDSLYTKLNGIEAGANLYVHPTTHPSNIINQPLTTVVFVDVGRADSYTADGSLTRPYKSLTDAINNAPAGKVVFKVSPNTYNENLVVTDNMFFVAEGAGRTVQLDGTVLYNTSGGNPSSISGFILNGGGVNPTVQFYGSNAQELRLDNCRVLSAGLQPALHMNNSNANSVVNAKHTEFFNSGSGLSTLVNGNNKFEHRMCKFGAEANIRCIEYADNCTYAGHMSYFGNQVKISDAAIGELHHPIFGGSGNDAIQHDGGVLRIAAPVNFTGSLLFSATSVGDINYATNSNSLGYIQDEPTDWIDPHVEVASALDELAARIKILEEGGGGSYTWYDHTSTMWWYITTGSWTGSSFDSDPLGTLDLFSAFYAFSSGNPTAMRLTFSGVSTINVTIEDDSSNTIVSNASYSSGDILDVSGGYSRFRILVSGATGLSVTAIELDSQADAPS